jgi:bifunctional non-homologous end joining protein LigD
LVRRYPDTLTLEFKKIDRAGRIFMDTGRNEYSATFAAAYTVRAKAGAPVSAPCSWEEVESGEIGPRSFTVRNMEKRLADVGDLWADLLKSKRSLTKPMARLKEIAGS